MGLIDISNKSDEIQGKTYLSYIMCDKILKLQVVVFKETPLHYGLNISKDSTILQKWAQNLQQSPEKYWDQLYISLQAKTLEEEKEKDEFQTKNIFELNEECLVWRQYFCDKKMFGRKGKFTLEKVEKKKALEEFMDDLVTDIKDKNKSIADLEKQNKSLLSEKAELLMITEKSVKMKEDLEMNLYKKFSTLLNAKKDKLSEYRKKLYELQGQVTSSSRQSVEKVEVENPNTSKLGQESSTTCNLSSDEYDEDTDVDSPHEVDHDDDITGNKLNCNLKRKVSSSTVVSEPSRKKAKSPIPPLVDSQDLLNASLEMELEYESTSNPFRKFKNL